MNGGGIRGHPKNRLRSPGQWAVGTGQRAVAAPDWSQGNSWERLQIRSLGMLGSQGKKRICQGPSRAVSHSETASEPPNGAGAGYGRIQQRVQSAPNPGRSERGAVLSGVWSSPDLMELPRELKETDPPQVKQAQRDLTTIPRL